MKLPTSLEWASLEDLTRGRDLDAEQLSGVLDRLVERGEMWRMSSGENVFYGFPPKTTTDREDAL
ncbi:hypothetical protein [Microbacterium sp. Bi121]|uniref:hypothetical protein n=1 Tax=Microbacterium sp. Bi121 TaxID=2822348 RepID=UPI001D32DAE4|nr:hypothetical protein [Microbacterium sp. Bi121]CAH0207243.1 hypothetical protein SRABI121_02634 [Microbacterium sp. Bi121]